MNINHTQFPAHFNNCHASTPAVFGHASLSWVKVGLVGSGSVGSTLHNRQPNYTRCQSFNSFNKQTS